MELKDIIVIICLAIIFIFMLYVLFNKVVRNRAIRFDVRWLALMKVIVNRLEIDYQLKLISENEYGNLMKEINEQMEVYEKWLSKIVG